MRHGKPPIYRTILDIDSPTRQQIHKALSHLRERDREPTREHILSLPRNFTKVVSCCGKIKYRDQLTIYYGEEFCFDCVEKWKAGE